MTKFDRWKWAWAVFLLCAPTTIAAHAQTLTTLASFNGTDGSNPYYGFLVQATDGNLYGTTETGGANGLGTVFKITTGGTLTTLYSFCAQTNCADGEEPYASLVQATNGNFYGTTVLGGANNQCDGGCGTVFEITPGGTLTTLYSFCVQEVCPGNTNPYPYGALIQATDGNFYGTTSAAGANGLGTVFKITAGGTLTTLHSFDGTDGFSPVAGLVQATDGNFYGTTSEGGANGLGTVFKITPAGTLTTLYSFCAETGCADGLYPYGALIQATDGNFYGTTSGSGTGPNGNDGTVFRITAEGTLTTLYSFCAQTNCTDGDQAFAGLIQATDGNFYGTTGRGGGNNQCFAGCGTIFQITTGGTLTTLHSFDETDGAQPYAGLVQATNGNFYGTTETGGADGQGTVFGLAVPQPVVTLAPLGLNFGNQTEGVASSPLPVTLKNTGGEGLLIMSIADANGFSQTNNCPLAPAALAPADFCTINVTFTPEGTGTANDKLIISDNAIGSPQMVSLTGVGVSGTPIASLAPSGLTFATQLIGTTSTAQTVTLTNTGGAALTIMSIGFTGTDAGDFKQSNNCGSALAAGKSCTINVNFSPVTPGISSATAMLSIADNATPSPQSTTVTGTVETFALSTTCTSLSVVPGQSAIYTVSLASVNGFAQSVGLSCGGAPALATCTVNPSMVTLDGSTTVQAQVTATTTPATSGLLQPFGQSNSNRLAGLIGLAGMAGLAGLLIMPGEHRVKASRKLWALLFCLCLVSTMVSMTSCGGGSGAGTDPPGTAGGTYPLTVTGTFHSAGGGTFTQKVTFDLVVQ